MFCFFLMHLAHPRGLTRCAAARQDKSTVENHNMLLDSSAASSDKGCYEIIRSLKHAGRKSRVSWHHIVHIFQRNCSEPPASGACFLRLLMACDANGRQRTRKQNLIKVRPRDIAHNRRVSTLLCSTLFTIHFTRRPPGGRTLSSAHSFPGACEI